MGSIPVRVTKKKKDAHGASFFFLTPHGFPYRPFLSQNSPAKKKTKTRLQKLGTSVADLACIFLNKKYVLYVIFFTLLDSFGVILLEKINFFTYIPSDLMVTELIGYRLLSAVVSGILLGICLGIMLKIGYSSRGMDIVACLVHKWKPQMNVERVISIFAYSIVGLSFLYTVT